MDGRNSAVPCTCQFSRANHLFRIFYNVGLKKT